VVAAEKVSARELDELAADAGGSGLPHAEGTQMVARIAAASSVRQGEELALWFNSGHLHLFDAETGRSLLATDGNGAEPAEQPGVREQKPADTTAEPTPPTPAGPTGS
jgi:multiple sugar transport system ATP-binding protein